MSGTSVRLFCLPYCGASAGVYLPWRDRLAPHLTVTPLELPGRGSRLGKDPCSGMETLLHDLVPTVARLCDRPFALFGHGLGALLAYEIAARLEWDHELVAERLYVSGQAAPHLPVRQDPLTGLPDDAFLAAAARHPGVHPAVLGDPALARLQLPVLRADFALAESYEEGLDNSVHAPLTATAGLDDPTVLGDELSAWRAYTHRSFRVRRFAGGHFHWRTREQPLLDMFVEDLSRRNDANHRFPVAERTF
ncbi:thioesterase II family protein [Streptomyces xanthii]|uniref:Thioesterase n=1 Tax=Streptomyces xanthii TaxID=2768069 RepID=A0A7H1BKK9_9ACTN|nr:thioesterase domain-containing protein [Streptomyces xanthii]QNS09264.1 thioesterase [Streptomyces xanthii]